MMLIGCPPPVAATAGAPVSAAGDIAMSGTAVPYVAVTPTASAAGPRSPGSVCCPACWPRRSPAFRCWRWCVRRHLRERDGRRLGAGLLAEVVVLSPGPCPGPMARPRRSGRAKFVCPLPP